MSMRLVLTIVSEEGRELGNAARREFGESGGTIGRNAGCTWVLQDPKLLISARHATINFNGRGFEIVDTSTNGVYVNSVKTPIGRGLSHPIAHGDTLYFADFVVSASVLQDAQDARRRLGAGAGAVSMRSEPPAPPSTSPSAQPGDVVGGAMAAPSPAPGATVPGPFQPPSSPRSVEPAPAKPAGSAIPADFWTDVLGSQAPSPLAGAPAASPTAAGLAGSSAILPSLDFSDLSGLARAPPPTATPASASTASVAAPQSPPAAQLAPPAATIASEALLPDAADPATRATAFGGAMPLPGPPEDAATRSPMAPIDHLAVLRQRAAGQKGASPLPQDAAPPASPSPPSPFSPPGQDRLRARPAPLPLPAAARANVSDAFWTGLGLDPKAVPQELHAELLEECGRALREAVLGLVPILNSRRSIKSELRVEQTTLQPRENNPLKFLPSGEAVLLALLDRERRGFLPLATAMREGFNDVKAHEVATLIALEAVARNILARFDPKTVESQAGAPSRLFGRGPDRAKLWATYENTHASLAGNLDKTAHELINEEFARAYAGQVQTMQKGDRR
jgi:type VI secretion system FHA domain protein